jgi:hypothetical protein
MSLVTTADEIAGSFLIVFGEREAMNVVIQRPPEIVHDPLPDIGGEIGIQIGTHGADDGDHGHRQHREVENRQLAGSDPANHGHHPAWQRPGLKQVIEDDFQRPRFEQCCRGFARYCEQRDRHGLPMRPQEADDAESVGRPEGGRHGHTGISSGSRSVLISSETF